MTGLSGADAWEWRAETGGSLGSVLWRCSMGGPLRRVGAGSNGAVRRPRGPPRTGGRPRSSRRCSRRRYVVALPPLVLRAVGVFPQVEAEQGPLPDEQRRVVVGQGVED